MKNHTVASVLVAVASCAIAGPYRKTGGLEDHQLAPGRNLLRRQADQRRHSAVGT